MVSASGKAVRTFSLMCNGLYYPAAGFKRAVPFVALRRGRHSCFARRRRECPCGASRRDKIKRSKGEKSDSFSREANTTASLCSFDIHSMLHRKSGGLSMTSKVVHKQSKPFALSANIKRNRVLHPIPFLYRTSVNRSVCP